MRRILVAVGYMLLCSSLVMAAGPGPRSGKNTAKHGSRFAVTTCPGNPVLTTDGTTNGSDFVNANTTNYYWVNLIPGHSYAVEVWDPFDAPNFQIATSILEGDCTTVFSASDVTFYDPDMGIGFGQRLSWIQPGSTEAGWQIALFNGDTVNGYS